MPRAGASLLIESTVRHRVPVAILVGTSGWQYTHWRRRFYPASVRQADWLPFYAERFDTVELDSPFYRLPERDQFERWAAAVAPGFCFAVKASRYLTHVRRLIDPAGPIERLMAAAEGLGDRLGPVLLQLPPTLELEPDRLDRALAAFPRGVRVAVEFRHPSWFEATTRRVLERHGAALCLADRSGPRTPLWATTDWGYLRLHGGRATPSGGYGRVALESWIERLIELGVPTTYVYFNNDWLGLALRDAASFGRLGRKRGLAVSRTPDPRSIAAG